MPDTLYKSWIDLNNRLMEDDIPKQQIANFRGAYLYQPSVHFQGRGFGLPEDPILFEEQKRVDLLESRYIDPELWQSCTELYERSKGSLSHSFLFNRKVKATPRAGGCLIGFTLSKHRTQYYCNVTSRSSEATMALLGDMYFLRHILTNLMPDPMKPKIKIEEVEFTWSTGCAQQNRYYAAVFIYMVYGKTALRAWSKEGDGSPWNEMCRTFYNQMINKEIELTGTPGKWQQQLLEWMT